METEDGWVTGPAVEVALELGGVRPGDQVRITMDGMLGALGYQHNTVQTVRATEYYPGMWELGWPASWDRQGAPVVLLADFYYTARSIAAWKPQRPSTNS